jgi:hypothetical protein
MTTPTNKANAPMATKPGIDPMLTAGSMGWGLTLVVGRV